MAGMDPTTTSSPDDNQVFLRGRLASTPVLRTLPSGDELCSFRLTVPRPAGDRVRVDSLDCASTRARVRRTVERAEPGDELEVSGSLHRRFWRSPGGLGSRYEVAVGTARVSARQPRRRQRTDA
jgi:single-strand DNA-binding protein